MNLFNKLNIKSFTSHPGVLFTGDFLILCGEISFYSGLIMGALDEFASTYCGPEKYLLPSYLKPASFLIACFDSFAKIFYSGVTNGLIGLTWPVSIPLIQTWYRYKSIKPIQEDKDQEK